MHLPIVSVLITSALRAKNSLIRYSSCRFSSTNSVRMESADSGKKSCYAAVRNKEHIAKVLGEQICARFPASTDSLRLLEVASGTGEHAALFLGTIPQLMNYQPSEMDSSMHESIAAWTHEFRPRVHPPVSVDVLDLEAAQAVLPSQFTTNEVDIMVCINMIHISPFSCTDGLFTLADRALQPGGFLLTYGPYRVNGDMVESNVQFDQSLKQRNPEWGVRDLEAVDEAAGRHGFQLKETVAMPANNLCVVFARR